MLSLDISRESFQRGKNYSSLRQQQGRLPLDSELNEGSDILADELRRAIFRQVEAISRSRFRTPASEVYRSDMVFSASALVQASAIVPPHADWMRPIGTSSSRVRCRPKKKPTAEKPATVSGEQTRQLASQTTCGS